MTEGEQIDHIANDLDRLIDRYRKEYDMTYASVIGVLHMKIYLLSAEAADRMGEDDTDGDDENNASRA